MILNKIIHIYFLILIILCFFSTINSQRKPLAKETKGHTCIHDQYLKEINETTVTGEQTYPNQGRRYVFLLKYIYICDYILFYHKV